MKKQIIAIVLLAGMFAPGVAFADKVTTSVEVVSKETGDRIKSLQAEVKSLLAQIEALKNVQNGQVLGVSTSTACLTLSRTLYKGLSGPDVNKLQKFLRDYPGVVWPTGTGITGYFGNVTGAAVRAFQKKEGLSKTSVPPINSVLGVVDKVTAEGIRKLT